MLFPIIVSSIFVLAVVVFCFLKPNAARIFLGLFFLSMAVGVNGYFTFVNPDAYIDYINQAVIPVYRQLALSVVSINPFLFGVLLICFEITMGLLILSRGRWVKYGLIGTMFFLAGMAPLGAIQIPWLGLIIGEIYLADHHFETSLFQSLRSRLLPAA